MSMYEVVFPDEGRAMRVELLSVLVLAGSGLRGLGRVRDVWMEETDDGPIIAVYTRNGGGNRQCHCDLDNDHADGCLSVAIAEMQHHPRYIEDGDDSFDSTYATFRFRLPDRLSEKAVENLRRIAVPRVDMSAMWTAAMERITNGDLTEGELAIGRKIVNRIESGESGVIQI